MDHRDWIILQVLYHKKNITKTAESLYISQPTLTNRLQQIEKEFGVQIVIRGRRGVQFTPQGEYLAKVAEEILQKIETAKETLLNMGQNVMGTLRLAVSNTFTHHKLPIVLKRFKDQYPDVEFKVTTGWGKDMINLLYNREVHVAFIRGDYNWPDEKQLLLEETICIASKEKIDMNDLPGKPRIDYHTDLLLKAVIDNWWAENFQQPPYTSIEVDKAETCKDMIVNGLGYSIIPSMILDDVKDIHTIDITNKEGEPILRRTWMFYHKESMELNIVKAFVDFIKGEDLGDSKS
ncbi:LysR family transcriptional regulator [Fictibacillus gelatini]|uniref:LysR family transcriptional regulator n=1 Tax=Fictibacillus gelatini TaxID=225985 RepID=UPI00040E886E|nr:LysR family transcriptional regulator [Fictibacillus gelatini]